MAMPGEFNPRVASTARMYDYYLGGKDHDAVDRETALRAMESWPAVRTAVRAKPAPRPLSGGRLSTDCLAGRPV